MQISAFPSYVSKELFSTRFLDHLIKERSEWTEARADALAARETLRKLYEKNKKQLPTMKEAQLEESWVRPVFKALGVAYDVQLCLPTANTQVTKSPDYALFADAEALQEAAPFRDQGGVEYYRRAAVIGEAKSWGTRRSGVLLKDLANAIPNRGALTGFNDAFFIDQSTRDRLVADDPNCTTIIRKFLRGENVKRWRPKWGNEWLIFSRRGIDIDLYPSIRRHLEKFRLHLEPKSVAWTGPWDGRKEGSYKWYELQDTVDYYMLMERPKLIYQQIQFHSAFAIDNAGYYLNDLVHFIPIEDIGIIASLNSSLMWWFMWFTAPHKKDEAYALHRFYAQELPVLSGPGDTTAFMASLTGERMEKESEFLDWLRNEASLTKLNQKVEAYWKLDEPSFLAELKKLKVKLSPAGLKQVKDEFNKSRAEILPNVAKARMLEKQLHAEVFRLYGLTDEEIALVRRTAPPRDPLTLVEQGALP